MKYMKCTSTLKAAVRREMNPRRDRDNRSQSKQKPQGTSEVGLPVDSGSALCVQVGECGRYEDPTPSLLAKGPA
ncbi:hypothetical protein J6590_047736 [Homalodisca vitripennis]|nr:hypothetical protein J6590_047736 [Homalodisca vitripennis]